MSITIKRSIVLLPVLLSILLLPACSKKEQAAATLTPKATLISVIPAASKTLEITEETVGSMESLLNPGMGAEVSGKVLQVLAHSGQSVKKGQLLAVLDATDYELQKREAQAEIGRIEALLANQGRMVELGFNQSMQHTRNCVSRRSVANETATKNLLL